MEQISQNLKKTMYPRLALYEALAIYKGEHERRQPANHESDDTCEILREFLDSFAYLCDAEKGGSTVTAAGLQKLPYSNILWLAANEGIRIIVQSYADSVLRLLVSLNSETEPRVREEVFQRAVQTCTPRLTFYNNGLRLCAKRCRMELRKQLPDDAVSAIWRKLRKLSEPPVSFTIAHIIDLCYNMQGREVDAIKNKSTHSLYGFGKLAHYIGRLGAPRSSVNAVVKAMSRVPALRQISQIRVIDAPEAQSIAIRADHMIPYEIVWAISKDSVSQNTMDIQSALHRLINLDLPSNDGTSNPIRTNLAARSTIITRVHAELQIGDQFSRHRFEFVGGDKYIGCSKPACYFCYNWLASHKHKYVQPATHYKIIPGCRGPDNDINESGATILKEMYSKLTLRVGQDIIDSLLHMEGDEAAGRKHQYMSTEGTSCATSVV
ncbi:hypothetical protein B0T10DRAFT_515951 [Thelonectria olida]|uniref:Uncharacterized protein n=1 Tax=Thelonectria olida TaxID=1576542 RepID=A0A9P8W225_9HYPO|nr:hypothetical protein B0T10DRAFT_515951 [Thelonectria olida]